MSIKLVGRRLADVDGASDGKDFQWGDALHFVEILVRREKGAFVMKAEGRNQAIGCVCGYSFFSPLIEQNGRLFMYLLCCLEEWKVDKVFPDGLELLLRADPLKGFLENDSGHEQGSFFLYFPMEKKRERVERPLLFSAKEQGPDGGINEDLQRRARSFL